MRELHVYMYVPSFLRVIYNHYTLELNQDILILSPSEGKECPILPQLSFLHVVFNEEYP